METSGNLYSPLDHKYFTRSKQRQLIIHYKEDSDLSDSDDESDSEVELDGLAYKKFLQEIFPSANMDKQVAAERRIRKLVKQKNSPINRNNCNIIIAKSEIFGKEDESSDDLSDISMSSSEGLESGNEEEDSDSEDENNDDENEYNGQKEDSDRDYKYSLVRRSPSLYNLSKKLMAQKKSEIIMSNLVNLANKEKNRRDKMREMKTNRLKRDYKSIQKKNEQEKHKKNKNTTAFKQLLSEKNNLNDLKYFKTQIPLDKQTQLIDELKEINAVSIVEKPYRILILEADIPNVFKISALKKISMMENMDPSVGEYFKIKNWIDTFMRIPFNKTASLPLTLSDGLDKCNKYMERSIQTLDSAVYGLTDAKMQIMQLVGQWIVNPDAIGTAVAIKGPMGTGKTTLVKEGISKILNRPFALIALGGATDSSTLEGHGYTYEGSTWGKIVDILIQTRCANPVIYFDELDKISDTPKGEEIVGILTHLIDTTQNNNFHDKYFAEIDFDLSKALFIFSYNDETKINPILRDRMYRISTKGYDVKEKKVIAKDYLLPNIAKQVMFEPDNVIIEDSTLDHIVEKYTEKEEGVRNLKRCLEIIYTKLNLYRLMKPDATIFKNDKALNVVFPFTVTNDIVDKLIKKELSGDENWRRMYM